MSRFRSTFKRSAIDCEDKRQSRVIAFKSNRRDKRGISFAAQRNVKLEEEEPENFDDMSIKTNNENQQLEKAQKTKKDNVKIRLQKWKEEKEKQKLKELQLKTHARPPFRAGNVHHSNNPIDILPLNVGKAVKKTLPASNVKKFEFKAFQSVAVPGPAQLQASTGAMLGAPAGKLLFTFQPKTPQVPVSRVLPTRTLRSHAVTNSTTPAAAGTTSVSRRGQVPAALPGKPKGPVKATPAALGLKKESTPFSRRGQAPTVGLQKAASSVGPTQSSVPKPFIASTRFKATPATTPSVRRGPIPVVPTKATPARQGAPKPAQQLAPSSLTGPGTTPHSSRGRNVIAGSDKEKGLSNSNGSSAVDEPISASPPKNMNSIGQQSKKTGAVATNILKNVTPSSKKEDVLLTKPKTSDSVSKPQKQDEVHDCAYFRALLANTIAQLEDTCEEWELESSGKKMSDEANEQLLLATGMARLLIREKFAQFRGLINTCEDPLDKTTMCSDLQGFWDMIYMQVEDINKKFDYLEAMKNNDWKPLETASNGKAGKKKVVAPAKAKPKPAAPKGRSNLRAFIAASRKNQEAGDEAIKTTIPDQDIESRAISAVRRSESRSSISSPTTRRRVDSPNVSAILSASRIAKSSSKKSYPIEEESAQKSVDQSSTQLQVSPVTNLSKTPVRSSRTRNPQETTPTTAGPSNKLSAPHHGILKRGEEPIQQAGTAKKSVIFSSTIHEQEEDDDMMLDSPVLPVTRTYSHHNSPVTPIKEKFDELLSVPPRKFSLLYTPPPQPGASAQATSKTKKPPTPYAGRTSKGRKSRGTVGEEGGPTPGLFAPTTPDLISFESPGTGGTPKLRRSSRFKNDGTHA